MKLAAVAGRSIADFFRDGGIMLAGALSYFTMMALVPFSMFLVTLFGYFLGEYPEVYQFFLSKLISYFPDVTREVTSDITRIVSHKGIGQFSLLLYGLLSYQVFASMETALNRIFKIHKNRGFVLSLIVSLFAVILILTLLIIIFAVSTLIPLLKELSPFLPGLKLGKVAKFILRFIVPFVLLQFSITLLYVLIPRTRVSVKNAFYGAMFATILLEFAKYIFAWYVGTVAQFGKIYGTMTAFIVFLLWMFYSSSIFLIGAEMVHNLGGMSKIRGKT